MPEGRNRVHGRWRRGPDQHPARRDHSPPARLPAGAGGCEDEPARAGMAPPLEVHAQPPLHRVRRRPDGERRVAEHVHAPPAP